MIKIYGQFASSAKRCLWVLEELGLPYDHIAYAQSGTEIQQAEFIKINPNGKIPVLVDGDVTVFESIAINVYLAERYKGDLWREDAADKAALFQWSFWGVAELEPHALAILIQKYFTEEADRVQSITDNATARLVRSLGVIDKIMANQPCLLGDEFTLADLNISSIGTILRRVEFDLSGFPHASRWLNACLQRDAYARLTAAHA